MGGSSLQKQTEAPAILTTVHIPEQRSVRSATVAVTGNTSSAVMGHHSFLWALAAVDGLTVKTDKAKLINVLKIDSFEKQSLSLATSLNSNLQFTIFFDTKNGNKRRLVTTTRHYEAQSKKY